MVPTVLVDGVPYRPATPRVGVAITTVDRQAVLDETLAAFETFSPEVPVVVIRDDQREGIPAAKNRCLTALMDLGVDHLFLFDDDTRPACADWYVPYCEGPEPHYTYCWTHFTNGNAVEKMAVLYDDDALVAYTWSMGCMLYVHRSAVERVGGMRREFGRGMEEHAEWSTRIHNAGLTTFVHQDIPASAKLIHAGDEYCEVARSFDVKDRMALLKRNTEIRLRYQDSDDFVPYRTPRNVILTSYLTNNMDIQRNRKLPADTKLVDPLIRSCDGHDLVLVHDLEDGGVTGTLPAYQQRWISQWQWLRDHPEVEYVWLVDALDVTMLNDPFPHMVPGRLYCGWEPKPIGVPWIYAHCPNSREWVDENAHRMLLNCGIVGGDRATVMKLCRRMNDLWAASDRSDPLEEMVFFNVAAYEEAWQLKTGPTVMAQFRSGGKGYEELSWWSHK